LKAAAYYSAARDERPCGVSSDVGARVGQSCGVSSDVGARGWGTDDDDMATLEQQHARWRNTYLEHETHVRHRARVPITDGLIEGRGNLQRIEGRAAVWSEQRFPSEGTADVDDDDMAMQ